jgi:phosphoribosyl 1,2-cyclic phosphodiesterase
MAPRPAVTPFTVAPAGEMRIRFWGVRGTIACPGPDYIRYGGNTSCIEVRCGRRLLILDAGTGLRALGAELAGQQIDTDLLLTHTHLDHLAGLPFFPPLFAKGNRFRLWAGHLMGHPESLRQVIHRMVEAPLFPVPLDAMAAELEFKQFHAGEDVPIGHGIAVRTAPLNHPNGATGYRIEYGKHSICYVTDTEHRIGERDANILRLIRGTDIFIYDCTYTDEEYPDFKGWGHSTWQEGARLAEAAGVKTLVVFHHAPEHIDRDMDAIADAVRHVAPDAVIAQEGMVLRP